mmetsp:Transcript_37158/g.54418  ORF Transcript_37158/g.54418 Transcript_37158/m.54418 type:complete len:118 (-) Transcript_37158:511-864(-)
MECSMKTFGHEQRQNKDDDESWVEIFHTSQNKTNVNKYIYLQNTKIKKQQVNKKQRSTSQCNQFSFSLLSSIILHHLNQPPCHTLPPNRTIHTQILNMHVRRQGTIDLIVLTTVTIT